MISVIIPTFNRVRFLKRAIDSVLRQTYQDFELIIIDDGSTDDSFELFSNYHPKISYIKQANKGVSSARNLGIKVANGDYIAFLDSDDCWNDDKLAKQVEFLQNHPHLQICHANETWLKNGELFKQSKHHLKSGGYIFQKSLALCLISPSTIILAKSVFFEHGLFDETMPACEDYDLWLRLTAFLEIGFISDILTIKHGGHQDQLSQKYWGMDRFRVQSLEKIINYPKLKNSDREAAIKMLLKKCNILIKGALKHNNHEIIQYYSALKEKYTCDES